MSGGVFWAVAAALAALVASVLIGALRRSPDAGEVRNADLPVYRDQLAEVDRDLERGTIGPDEAARLRAEVGKRVLDADRARSADANMWAIHPGAMMPQFSGGAVAGSGTRDAGRDIGRTMEST